MFLLPFLPSPHNPSSPASTLLLLPTLPPQGYWQPDDDMHRYHEFETLPGWAESTSGVRTLPELPNNAQRYIERIEETVDAPIDIISTGPDRNETIVLKDPFKP